MLAELHPPAFQTTAILRADLPALPGARRRLALKAVLLSAGRLLTVEGAETLRAHPEPVIFALNHGNAFEALVVPASLMFLRGRPVHFLADWMYLQIPLLGGLLRLGEPIPVFAKPARWRLGETYRRQRRRDSVLEACLERLAAGGSLGIFPEGTRNPDPGRLLRARSGLGEIVLQSTAPVVPVGLHYPAAARLGRVPGLGRLVLRAGEAMTFREERQAARRLAPGVPRLRRALARSVVDQVMVSLETLSGKSYDPQTQKRRVA
jgi:1-acyl-sn-glycerol-3-phosphate acyltransferase